MVCLCVHVHTCGGHRKTSGPSLALCVLLPWDRFSHYIRSEAGSQHAPPGFPHHSARVLILESQSHTQLFYVGARNFGQGPHAGTASALTPWAPLATPLKVAMVVHSPPLIVPLCKVTLSRFTFHLRMHTSPEHGGKRKDRWERGVNAVPGRLSWVIPVPCRCSKVYFHSSLLSPLIVFLPIDERLWSFLKNENIYKPYGLRLSRGLLHGAMKNGRGYDLLFL